MVLRASITILHHKEEFHGTRMDLAYISPQLIASAMPSTSYIQGFYRSSLAQLVTFLDTRHPNHWHIWNLQQDCELGYDPSVVVDRNGNPLVTRVPTPDHHPMAFNKLISTIRDINEYLLQDPENVALIHCKCGKGRTGTVIAAYLIFYGGMTTQHACSIFTQRRIRITAISAVSILSQIRYLRYLEKNRHLVENSSLDSTARYSITHVIIHNSTFTEYDVRLKSLTPGGPSIRDWSSSVRSNIHVLKCTDTPKHLMPADLTLEFTGFSRIFGVKIPLTCIVYSFNLELEDIDTDNFSSDGFASGPSLTAYDSKKLSVFSRTNDSKRLFVFWKSTEGLGGLPLRGNKGFDSIEICWSRSQATVGPTCFEEQVPSLNSYHEKIHQKVRTSI